MKVLVTGANGYIGRHVVKALLDKGADVIGCDISEFFEDEEKKRGDFAGYFRYKGIHYTADTLEEFFKQVDELKIIAK